MHVPQKRSWHAMNEGSNTTTDTTNLKQTATDIGDTGVDWDENLDAEGELEEDLVPEEDEEAREFNIDERDREEEEAAAAEGGEESISNDVQSFTEPHSDEQDREEEEEAAAEGGEESISNDVQSFTEPHRGRTRRGKGKGKANPFIDDEATGGEESPDEESEDDDEAATFINDEHNPSDTQISNEILNQLHNTDAHQYQWDDLLDRAYDRAKSGQRWPTSSVIEDGDEYVIAPHDQLWVAGEEEHAIFTIFNRSTHPTSPHAAGPSAMFNPSHPGRIYVEACNEQVARATVEAIPGLFTSFLKHVPLEERQRCVSNSPRTMPLWVRIRDARKKWKAVNGSVGLIVPILNNTDETETWTVVVAYKEPLEASPQWVWKSVNLDEITFKINLGELPTVRDIQKFANCPHVNEYHLKTLFERIYRTNLRPGARVRVTQGDFVGALGEIVASDGSAADIRLEDGAVETVPLHLLRRNFVIGDQVIVTTMPWRGTVGWVVAVDGEQISIWSDSRNIEYHVASIEAEFFTSSFQHCFSLPPTIKRRNMTAFDRLACFKGRAVYVTSRHPLKGNRGCIKETHPDGRVWIQLESVLAGNRLQVFKHTELSLIEDETELLVPLIGRSGVLPQKAPFAQIGDLSAHTSMAKSVVEEPESGPTTPTSQPLHHESLPIVDDTITFPDTEPPTPATNADPYWLVDACFDQRIKLAHVHDPNHIVQLIGRGSASGLVKVRDRTAVVELSACSLSALPPRDKNDVVVVLSGEHVGSVYKVVEVRLLDSQVKKPGRAPRKKVPDPIFSNDILIQAFGAFK